MRSTPLSTPVAAAKSQPAAARIEIKPLPMSDAAEIMWLHYRDNKAQLVSDIGDYRDHILAGLMAGTPVGEVFAPFAKPAGAAKPVRRAR